MPEFDSPSNLIIGPLTFSRADWLVAQLLYRRIAFTVRPLLPNKEWEVQILQPISADVLFYLTACIFK